jgi:hypothetical protein
MVGSATQSALALFLNAVREFLDDRVCQDLAGDALDLVARLIGRKPICQ